MRKINLFVLVSLSLLFIGAAWAAPVRQEGAVPVAQPLVREGDLALSMAEALGLGRPEQEDEAESILASAGIAPRNGWISDYPVTPDVLEELRQAAFSASDSASIPLQRQEVEQAILRVISELGLPQLDFARGASPAAEDTSPYGQAAAPVNLEDYYSEYGPPVVTYYPPPLDYSYLYSFVPYPFWCSGFWFGGFFVLHDFHKIVIVKKVKKIVSNKVFDREHRRAVKIDPVTRGKGPSRWESYGNREGGNGVLPGQALKGAGDILEPSRQPRPAGSLPRGNAAMAPRTGKPGKEPGTETNSSRFARPGMDRAPVQGGHLKGSPGGFPGRLDSRQSGIEGREGFRFGSKAPLPNNRGNPGGVTSPGWERGFGSRSLPGGIHSGGASLGSHRGGGFSGGGGCKGRC